MLNFKVESALEELSDQELSFLLDGVDELPKGKNVMDIVEWAEKRRYLPAEITAKSGFFDWSYVPHLIEPARCLSVSSPIRHVAICKGVQIGATTGITENLIGYTVDEDPCGLLYCREERDAAELAMELQVDLMLELSGLKDKLIDVSGSSSGKKATNRKLFKRFAGGFIFALGMKNPSKSRSNPARKLCREEIDAWPDKVRDGDTLEITEKRTTTFPYTKKIADVSTPLLMETSKIWKMLLASDWCKRFVPCPYCGEFQELVWFDKENDTGFRYEYDDDYILVPGSTHYRCSFCEKGKKIGITEEQKHRVMNAGEYRATQKAKKYLMRGFHIPSWYSVFEPWDEIASDWLAAQKDKSKLQTFRNLRMALPFEEVEFSPKPEMLKGKQRKYIAGQVPNEIAVRDGNGPILVLTCSVDVHKAKTRSDGRLDVEVLGHCRNGSTYSITWRRFEGDTEPYWFREYSAAYQADPDALKQNTWFRFEQEILTEQYVSDDGKVVYPIRLTGVDMSYQTYMVQTFCKQYESGVIPIHGVGSKAYMVNKVKERKGDHGMYWDIVVDKYKDLLAEYMGLRWQGHPLPQPSGSVNYPYTEQYNQEYFDQYGQENKIPRYDEKSGRYLGTIWKRKYDGAPNHAWDCRVYNMALLDIYIYNICKECNIEGMDYKFVFDELEAELPVYK